MFHRKLGSKFRGRQSISLLALGGILLALIALGLPALWTFPPASAGVGYQGVILSASVDSSLKRACFDCHSNNTRWPWYARIPLVGMILNHGASEGRSELNFSRWDRLSAGKKRKALAESIETIREGEMPPWGYLLLHRPARLTEAESNALLNEMRAGGGGVSVQNRKGKEDEHHREDDEHGEDEYERDEKED